MDIWETTLFSNFSRSCSLQNEQIYSHAQTESLVFHYFLYIQLKVLSTLCCCLLKLSKKFLCLQCSLCPICMRTWRQNQHLERKLFQMDTISDKNFLAQQSVVLFLQHFFNCLHCFDFALWIYLHYNVEFKTVLYKYCKM